MRVTGCSLGGLTTCLNRGTVDAGAGGGELAVASLPWWRIASIWSNTPFGCSLSHSSSESSSCALASIDYTDMWCRPWSSSSSSFQQLLALPNRLYAPLGTPNPRRSTGAQPALAAWGPAAHPIPSSGRSGTSDRGGNLDLVMPVGQLQRMHGALPAGAAVLCQEDSGCAEEV